MLASHILSAKPGLIRMVNELSPVEPSSTSLLDFIFKHCCTVPVSPSEQLVAYPEYSTFVTRTAGRMHWLIDVWHSLKQRWCVRPSRPDGFVPFSWDYFRCAEPTRFEQFLSHLWQFEDQAHQIVRTGIRWGACGAALSALAGSWFVYFVWFRSELSAHVPDILRSEVVGPQRGLRASIPRLSCCTTCCKFLLPGHGGMLRANGACCSLTIMAPDKCPVVITVLITR